MAQAPIDMAETSRSGQVELDVKGYELLFDELREETLQIEKQVWNKRTCDICFLLNLRKICALYLCYSCEKYVCGRCYERHDQSHLMVEIKSKRGERDGQIERYLDEMRNESKIERKEILDREEVSVVDRVSVKHELDKSDTYWITGLCGLDDTRWVVCDYYNDCIKMFSIGSHILQRYLRFGSVPWCVTEIKVKREPTLSPLRAAFKNLFSVKREPTKQSIIPTTNISVPNQSKPNKQCIIAVTLPRKRRLLIINLTKSPAVITKSIKTKKHCYSIEFSRDKIFTVCIDDEYRRGPWFVSVMSRDGIAIKTINTDLPSAYIPYLAVCLGRFYLTDSFNDKVFCMNDKGKVVSHKTIEGSRPQGISVDPDTNNIYICAAGQHKLYRLDSRFESFESLIDLKSVDSGRPQAVCLYRDRLYVSHGSVWSTNGQFVTVVRVL